MLYDEMLSNCAAAFKIVAVDVASHKIDLTLCNFSLCLITKNLSYYRTTLYIANGRIESLSLIVGDLHIQVRGWDHVIVCIMMIANVVCRGNK